MSDYCAKLLEEHHYASLFTFDSIRVVSSDMLYKRRQKGRTNEENEDTLYCNGKEVKKRPHLDGRKKIWRIFAGFS